MCVTSRFVFSDILTFMHTEVYKPDMCIFLDEITMTSLLHLHTRPQEVVVWLPSMAQVSENRSKLRDAVMHDDIIRERRADYSGEENVGWGMWERQRA